MRFSLKVIAIGVCLAIVLVVSYQAYWLRSFFQKEYEKLEASVTLAMRMADLNELSQRIGSVQQQVVEQMDGVRKAERSGKTVYLVDNVDQVTAASSKYMDITYVDEDTLLVVNPPDVVVRIKNEQGEVNMWNDLDVMNASVQWGFHAALDSLRPIHLVDFDSLLQVELSRQHIQMPYKLLYADEAKGEVLDSLLSPAFQDKQTRMYSLAISEDQRYAYRLYLDNPRWHVFKSMGGLVLVSLLMLAVLIISYIYLLKIISRQKTIDEMKSDFTNNMTHELKTPISIASAAIEGIRRFGLGDDPEKREEYLAISHEQLSNLNSLVEQILTMSVEERKNLKLQLVDVSLQQLFVAVKRKFLLRADKRIHFETTIDPIDLSILADKIHLANILSNLVENAIKYSGEEATIQLSAYQEGNDTLLEVADKGIGIPASALPRLFDKFYRVHTGNIHTVKGYGLGLYYVKTMVGKHGWRIEVESKEGQGTRFILTIP